MLSKSDIYPILMSATNEIKPLQRTKIHLVLSPLQVILYTGQAGCIFLVLTIPFDKQNEKQLTE